MRCSSKGSFSNGGSTVKKFLFIAVVAAIVLGLAGTALAVTPSVSDPTTGRSVWGYKDLADSAVKYEGGYAAFSNTEFAGDYDNPHGGYDTATNKCKVCHAVHRAEGAYYLLRADSQDDACDYCHIGGSAHSSKVVYDLNSAGTATPTGTPSAPRPTSPTPRSPSGPKRSPSRPWTPTALRSTETIEVRAYDEQKNDMYRFARHHGHSMRQRRRPPQLRPGRPAGAPLHELPPGAQRHRADLAVHLHGLHGRRPVSTPVPGPLELQAPQAVPVRHVLRRP